jgi:hypothetical protein
MPRFGTKSLLIAVAVVALWLSTLSGYRAGDDVRRSVLLAIFVLAGIAALVCHGPQRAFWGGFFAVMFIMAFPFYSETFSFGAYTLRFMWANNLIESFTGRVNSNDVHGQAVQQGFIHTIWAVWTLGLATFVGIVSARIYSANRTPAE